MTKALQTEIEKILTISISQLFIRNEATVENIVKKVIPPFTSQQLKLIERVGKEVVGEDIEIGKSKVIWTGDGGVKAQSADDLREGWNNMLKATQRQSLDKITKELKG